MVITFCKLLASEILLLAINVLVLILFARPAAKQGPLIAEMLLILIPFSLNNFSILSEIVLNLLLTIERPFVNSTIEVLLFNFSAKLSTNQSIPTELTPTTIISGLSFINASSFEFFQFAF